MQMTSVGILALQGCVEPHIQLLKTIGVNCLAVRLEKDFEKIERLIIPGGESTSMLCLLERMNLFEPLRQFAQTHPVWGICAGAILLAKEVQHPSQKSLGLIDVRATRNFYGCQLDSFKTRIEIPKLGVSPEVDFIRAPLLEPLSRSVDVMAKHNKQCILMQQGNIMLSSFHIELSSESALHSYFLSL